ncbi:MAG: hypothetical protein Q8N39_06045 [Pelolinea sp.]|nr:hypothetical protein [Pelolinea sp.]
MKLIHTLKNTFRDSLFLLKLSTDVSKWDGVKQAVVVMGTNNNKDILHELGLFDDIVNNASSDDLIIAVELDDQLDGEKLLKQLDDLIKKPRATEKNVRTYKDLNQAIKENPFASIVMISTPGKYAAEFARESLKANRHVFCFSQHVSSTDELELKNFALEKNLLMMGPDCGTSILDGVGFGFANAIRLGPIGLVSAAGSGLQEVSMLIHRAGSGITQAIGVGGNDMTPPINGIMAEFGVNILGQDPRTKVIVILAKKSSEESQERVINAARKFKIKIVANFSSVHPKFLMEKNEDVVIVDTFEECAKVAVELTGTDFNFDSPKEGFDFWAERKIKKLNPLRIKIRGLYGGGSLCSETVNILDKSNILTNSNIKPNYQKNNINENLILDLGAEEFTEGRAHPFIDHRLRSMEIMDAFKNPNVGIILLDVVLGWGSHEDPAGEVVTAVRKAQQEFGEGPVIICSIIGTDEDFQDINLQKENLLSEDIYIAGSNASAAKFAAELQSRLKKRQL